MIKRLPLLLCLFLFFVALSGTCLAQTFTITDQELTTLENGSMQLSKNNQTLSTALAESKQDLQIARQESKELKAQLIQLKEESSKDKAQLQTANELLKNSNESYRQYAKEKETQIKSLEQKNNLLQIVAAAALLCAAIK